MSVETQTPGRQPDREPDSVVAFFDRRAESYDREYRYETPGGFALRVRREKVMQLFDQPGGRVLDVGCGPGVMVESILSRGCRFWGMDPSMKMIAIARARFREEPRAHFTAGDAMNLPAASGFFDAVLCMGVTDALPDQRLAVREMLRVLRPGGTLIVTFTNKASPYAWWKNYILYPAAARWHRLRLRLGDRGMPPERVRHGALRRLLSLRRASELVESEGAAVTAHLGYYYNVFLSPLDDWFNGAALAVTKKLESGDWPRPEWLCAGWILQARKR